MLQTTHHNTIVPNLNVILIQLLVYTNILHLVLSTSNNGTEKIVLIPPISHNPNDVEFFLFLPPSGSNNTQRIEFRNESSLMESQFVPNILTVIFIHGYDDAVFDPLTTLRVMNAYLASGIQANFLAVGWSKLGSPTNGVGSGPIGLVQFVTGYLEVLPNMPIVANRVAEFICWLCQRDLVNFSQLHIIGHSLGAHVAGETGARLQKFSSGEKVWRITGLDPAGPFLEPPITLEPVLDKDDGLFVDAIHTSVSLYGDTETNGDVDVYVNNGVIQPGCWSENFFQTIDCSHDFAVRVYVAGFQKLEIACKCPLWRYLLGQCHKPCNDPIAVGPFIPDSTRGIYHLETSANP